MNDLHHYLVDLRQQITDIIDNLDHDQFIAAQRAEFDHDELADERSLADDLAAEVRMLRATLIRMAKAAGPAWTPRWGDTEAPLDDVLARHQAQRGGSDG